MINYPNPVNFKAGEIVTIECTSDATLETTLYLYDLAVRLLWQKNFSLQGSAANRLVWNGYNNYNERAGNGICFYRIIDSTTKKSLAKGKIWIINQ